MSPSEQVAPEITAEMRQAARENPNTWLYVIDPALDPDDEVPPWGVIGAYPVNGDGEIEENFHANTAYRPSPTAVAEPEPDPEPDLERLLELVKAGERDQEVLPPAVLAARLLLYAASPEDTSVTGFPNRRHGTVMVPVCTSPAHVPPAWPGWREISGRDLVPLLRGHPLVINPGGPVTALIPAGDLAAAG
ncbi:MAG TPA: type VII secretion system-associated protein [Actinophytocola sp.]|uniref:type VII secretion system-associated protein n=1 Tax=Actinophytocola sp. TaxID=1872138 RepID=UPI002DDD355C|nr:type VII secretion system-associated protein [Actinophytocola sp.]HEV2783454.1 type VII secretion system-associated protein [Actinophytocola sp.]